VITTEFPRASFEITAILGASPSASPSKRITHEVLPAHQIPFLLIGLAVN